MKELDNVITNLCNEINKNFENGQINDFVLDEIKVLAELVSSQNMCFDGENITNTLNDQVKPIEENLESIEKMVKEICENRLIGFESKQEDAQLIAEVIKILAKKNLSISYAQAILEDAKKILSMIVTL